MPTEEERKAITEYGEWLGAKLEELCISQTELAAKIGKSQKTVSRYVSGENQSLPPEEVMKKIDRFIERKSEFLGWKHMPPEKFGGLLGSLLADHKITQAQLAEKCRTDQRTVSQYVNGTVKTSTMEQYFILIHLFECERQNEAEREKAEEYAKKLRETVEELCIPIPKLAKKIRRSESTVMRYLSGAETAIPFADLEAIDRIIKDHSKCIWYRHMFSGDFGRLIVRLMEELEISVEEFAQKNELDPQTARGIIGGVTKTSAEQQYDILKYFLVRAGHSPGHEDTYEFLNGLFEELK